MPRKPTGRPRGRQLGSGALGLGTQDEHTRLTLRIPNDLYTRLEAFAEGRAYTRGTPHLARCVRDAIEHYLACPNKRQTSSVLPLLVNTWQTSNCTQEAEDNNRQTSKGHEDNTGQTTNNTTPGPRATADLDAMSPGEPVARAPQPTPPARDYDPSKYVLGKLCPRKHAYQGSGQSLLRRTNRHCLRCDSEKAVVRTRRANEAKRQQAQRQATPA